MPSRRGGRWKRSHGSPTSIPGSSTRSASSPRCSEACAARRSAELSVEAIGAAKRYGFSDRRIAYITGSTREAVRDRRHAEGVVPVYKRVDTCAAEFESHTPYLYSTYEEEDESDVEHVRKVVILGSGPNRIGQGIEFDYCCCHASFALREEGVQSIMVNCNPETVSTDYDTSDRLYFEPLTLEDVREVLDREKPDGVIVQFGGQTPLNLTRPLADLGRQDPRHACRFDRPRRGPRALRRLPRQSWTSPIPSTACPNPRARPKTDRRAARLPAARAALVRARRPRHGHCLQRQAARRAR